MDPLIDAATLQELLCTGGEQPVVIGVLPAGRFLLHHIPGSHQVWRPGLSRANGSRLIEAAGFQRWAHSLGIGARTRVIVWDERYDATRLWWAFHHYGKTDVQVLDGGLEARRDAGIQLWDARDEAERSGRRRLRGARRAGRIPWAAHLDWRLFRHGARHHTRFRAREELLAVCERHGLDPARRQIFYCQSGVRTTAVIFALHRLGWNAQQLLQLRRLLAGMEPGSCPATCEREQDAVGITAGQSLPGLAIAEPLGLSGCCWPAPCPDGRGSGKAAEGWRLRAQNTTVAVGDAAR
jgi:thiosulfate/3-mercaptopyruvate sulfurtransferase